MEQDISSQPSEENSDTEPLVQQSNVGSGLTNITKDNQKIESIVKNTSLASSIYKLITFIPFALIIILAFIYFISKGLPWYVGGIFIFFIIVMFALSMRDIIATSLINLNKPMKHKASEIGIEVEEDEKIIGIIAGILKTGFGIRSKPSFFRAQVNIIDPQNSIILTNKHIHFIFVPILGSDQNIGAIDLGVIDFVTQRKNILDKLNQMIEAMSLSQILRSDDRNFSLSLSNIQKVKSSNFRHVITFITKDNKKYSYAIRDNKDYQYLKQTFHV